MASTYTPKLNLAKPANGDIDWHIPINENWDKIDTELDKALKISGTTIDADKDWGGKAILNAGQIGTQQYFLAPSEIPGHRVYSDLAPSTVYGTSWEAAKTVMVPANQEGVVRVRYAGTPGGTCTWRLTLNGSEVPGTSGSGSSAFDQDMLISVSAGDVIAVEGHADYSMNWLTVTALEIYAIPVPNLAGSGW